MISHSITPKKINIGRRVDRFGIPILKGNRTHRVCFADEKPNGKTSGVILVKIYNVESFKEFNKMYESKSKGVSSTGKDKYIEADEYSCTCSIF